MLRCLPQRTQQQVHCLAALAVAARKGSNMSNKTFYAITALLLILFWIAVGVIAWSAAR